MNNALRIAECTHSATKWNTCMVFSLDNSYELSNLSYSGISNMVCVIMTNVFLNFVVLGNPDCHLKIIGINAGHICKFWVSKLYHDTKVVIQRTDQSVNENYNCDHFNSDDFSEVVIWVFSNSVRTTNILQTACDLPFLNESVSFGNQRKTEISQREVQVLCSKLDSKMFEIDLNRPKDNCNSFVQIKINKRIIEDPNSIYSDLIIENMELLFNCIGLFVKKAWKDAPDIFPIFFSNNCQTGCLELVFYLPLWLITAQLQV